MTLDVRGKLAKIKDETSFYAHQLEGIRTLASRQSFMLGDEMGLGKSVQALTIAAIDFEMGSASKVLVVAPASLKWNWAAEIAEHTHFTCLVLERWNATKRSEAIRDFTEDILIVNYEQVVAHVSELNAVGFDIAIIDEAHYLAGHRSKRTRACHGLQVKRFFLLSGSFLLDQVDDLWSPLKLVTNEFPSYYAFLNRYAVFGGYKDKDIVGIKNEAELVARLDEVMLRREKKDVLDLPEKVHIPIVVELHPEQRKLYDKARDELLIEVPDDPKPLELENALTKMLRLKQICGTTATIPGYGDNSVKLDVATERACELVRNGHKVVIFTQFREVLRCMADRLRANGVPVYEMHGDVKIEDRVPLVREWEAAPRPGVVVAMLQVAGVGLNMTAARHAIFLDKLWVPSLNAQAEDRLHRIGADKAAGPIEIIHIMCRGTVESRVETILKRKSEIFDAVMGDSHWKKRLLELLTQDDADDL